MATPGSTAPPPQSGAFHGVPPGGIPDNTDIILSSIFIALFLLTGIYFHFRLFHAYGKKFIWSILCFGFCMARIAALSFRIVTVKNPTNTALNIVAQVLIAAGVVLLFFVNLQMSRRFFGQLHPQHAVPVKRFITIFMSLIIPVLAMVITTVIQSFLTTDARILDIDRKVRLVGSCFMVLLAFIPIPVVLIVLLLQAVSPGGLDKGVTPAEDEEDPEDSQNGASKPGNGVLNDKKMNGKDRHAVVEKEVNGEKVTRIRGEPTTGFGPTPVKKREILESALVILIPGALLTFEQGIRCTQAFYVAQPGAATPWYMTKATFWTCIFAFEWISVLIFGLAVLPRRFSHLRIV